MLASMFQKAELIDLKFFFYIHWHLCALPCWHVCAYYYSWHAGAQRDDKDHRARNNFAAEAAGEFNHDHFGQWAMTQVEYQFIVDLLRRWLISGTGPQLSH